MRLFVSCSECQRQYQVSPQKIGQMFRCHCGRALSIQEANAHDAHVIRCSSCGAAREKASNRCGYCQADFTIHERDLHTVCPKCMARVSDKARFCAQCGSQLAGEQVVEDVSELACPLCGPERRLTHRKLGQEQVNVLECSMCAGFWMGREAFRKLRDRVLQDTAAQRSLQREADRPQPNERRNHVGPRYRKCIYCDKLMNRRQYAKGSGVLIDICRDHGIWFDAHELQQILDWIARGGEHQNRLAGKPVNQVSETPVGSAPVPPAPQQPAANQPPHNAPPPNHFENNIAQNRPQRSQQEVGDETDVLGILLNSVSSWFR